MELGRKELELLQRGVVALEHFAKSNEEIVALAKDERAFSEQPGPSFCPHCQTLNPRVSNEGGDGSMADFVLVARCQCGNTFYAVPQGWVITASAKDAREIRAETNGT